MIKQSLLILTAVIFSFNANSQSTLTWKDIEWNETGHAGMSELRILTAGSLVAGLIYTANGTQKHPTLFVLHGWPGNERNLDVAQMARNHGWNVIYFNYRGSWGSQGEYTFKHCVEDVVNAVQFCKKYADSFRIDTSNIALFGHSLGGWVCLKAAQQIPGVKKAFALSAWNLALVANDPKGLPGLEKRADDYFMLNKKSGKELFRPVIENPAEFDLVRDAAALAKKQVIMIDEHQRNAPVANAIKAQHPGYFEYEVWNTSHTFDNKRVELIKRILEFLDR